MKLNGTLSDSPDDGEEPSISSRSTKLHITLWMVFIWMLMFNDMHLHYYNIVAVSERCFEQCVCVSRLFRSLRNIVRLPQTDWLSLPGRHRGRQDTQGAQCCGNSRGDGRRVSTEPQVILFVPVRAPNVFLMTGLTHLLLKHQSLHLFSNTNFTATLPTACTWISFHLSSYIRSYIIQICFLFNFLEIK